MDIRTKLVFVLVAVALGSMLVLGAIMYSRGSGILRDAMLEQLDGFAASRAEALDNVIAGWHDQTALISSRTQLRTSLREYNRSGSTRERDRVREILGDALRTARRIEAVSILAPDGSRIVSVDRRPEVGAQRPEGVRPLALDAETTYGRTWFTDTGEPRVEFLAALTLDGEHLGILEVRLTAEELAELTDDYAGLGETGEVVIVAEDENGRIRPLHPVRNLSDSDGNGRPSPNSRVTSEVALQGEVGRFWEDVVDYRGEPVRAATRYMPETGWGMVVKYDVAEDRASVLSFRQEMLELALSLAAFAILIGVVLAFRIATPIHDLAGVANRIREGEMDARADTGREDEIGLLSRTFNNMADELEERMTQLHEFQRFFEVSLDLLCIAGTDGFFKRVNPAFEKTLGWSSEELLSQPFVALVHPDDVEATLLEVDRLSEGIPTVSFENRFRRSDGTYKRLRWTSYPEPDTGLLYAIARDVGDVS